MDENDIRLLRRFLVARLYNDLNATRDLSAYLGKRGIKFIPPDTQDMEMLKGNLSRLQANELYLVQKYGCMLLPDYHNVVFLNSMWANPYTLYVRLVYPVEELGVLGEIYWTPEKNEGRWRRLAKKNHIMYLIENRSIRKNYKPWWRYIFQ